MDTLQIIIRIKEDMEAEYKNTTNLENTYFYWRGFIDGIFSAGFISKNEKSALIEYNRQLYWNKKDRI